MSKFEPELWGGSLPAANLTLYSTAGIGTSDYISFKTGSQSERLKIDTNGNVVVGSGALATNASNGFFYIPGSAGTPTGTPTSNSGRVPIDYDTTNDRLYFYSNGAWRLIGSTGTVFNNDFTVEDYGAVGDGVTDDTAAIQDAIDAAIANGGGTVYFSAKTYKFTSTLTINSNFITLEGKGKSATTLLFVPTANDTAIEVNKGAAITSYVTLRGLKLHSSDTTYTKIGVALYDVSHCLIEDFRISGDDVGVGGSSSWGGGTGSIGVKTFGREFILIPAGNIISAERPLLISNNPNGIGDFDFCEVGAQLVADNFPCVEAEDGAALSNSTFSGSWNGGTYGFYWSDSTSLVASINVKFRDIRLEQGQSTTAHNLYIDPYTLQGLSIENVYIDNDCHGVFLRNILYGSIKDCFYTGTDTALDIDGTVLFFSIFNTVWSASASTSITGQNTNYKALGATVAGSYLADASYSVYTANFTVDKLTANLSIVPDANDGASLGISGTAFSDLFLASGGVVNFNAGDVSITHASNTLTFTGASSGGYGFDSTVVPTTNDGASLGNSSNAWSDLYLASGGLIDWANGDVTASHSTNTLTFAGATDYVFSAGADNSFHINSNTGYNVILFKTGLSIAGGASADNNLYYDTTGEHKLRVGGNVRVNLANTSLYSAVSDVVALGSTTNMWSDLFLASGGVVNFNNGDVTLTHSTDTLTIGGPGTLVLAAGTTAVAPLKFQSGTNLTSAADGAMEWDGQALFFSPDASDRRIIPAVAITRLHAAYTLADSTSAQKMFNASANGALTLPTGSYIFECVVGIDAMSGTSGNAALSIIGAGGATVTNTLQVVVGIDGAKATAGAAAGASWSATNDAPAANTSVVTAGVSTEMAIMWKGSFEVTGSGTIIPSVDLITGGVTPAVKLGSYFMCWRMGAATDVTQGNWS